MKHHRMLAIASLLSILFMTLHLAEDIVRGFEPGGLANLVAIPILVAWLYGALLLADRRSGLVIILLGSVLGMVIPVIHFRAPGGVAGGDIATSRGAFVWVWTLLALGVSSLFAATLAVHGLLTRQKDQSR